MFHIIPEELIERILRMTFEPAKAKETQILHLSKLESNSSNVLLVSRKFYRIALPIFYSHIHLSSRKQASRLLKTLTTRFRLAHFVRNLTVAGVWSEAGIVIQMCGRTLTGIEYTLDRPASSPTVAPPGGQWSWGGHGHFGGSYSGIRPDDIDVFCRALRTLRAVKHLTVRKAHNLYITSTRAQILIQETANAIMSWPALTNVQMIFTLPDDEGRLAAALATRPHLRTLTTCLPSIWNTALLSISENPHLKKITLIPCTSPRASLDFTRIVALNTFLGPASTSILPNGLFLTEARKHTRLNSLVRRGTLISI